MLVLASVRLDVCNQLSSESVFFFPDIPHISRNLETEKRNRIGFSRKILFTLKSAKKRPQMGPKWSFYDFSKKFPKRFAGVKMKNERYWSYLFSCANPLSRWENSRLQVNGWILGQNAIIQSDYKILWSSISLEVMHVSIASISLLCGMEIFTRER